LRGIFPENHFRPNAFLRAEWHQSSLFAALKERLLCHTIGFSRYCFARRDHEINATLARIKLTENAKFIIHRN
jgi:hypothetical protein